MSTAQGISGGTSGLRFGDRLRLHGELMIRFLRESPSLALLSAMPGNSGDHLIWAGTRRLLESYWLRFSEVPVAQVTHPENEPADTLVIPGSGAFGRYWHEWLPELVIAASESYRRVVVLPSTYDVSVPIVSRALRRSNVFAFAREVSSYRQAKALGHVVLGFDPALYAWEFDLSVLGTREDQSSKPPLLALRTDAGSLLGERGLIPHPDLNQDISLTSPSLESFVEWVAGAPSVVTDRLHVAVAAIMLGKRVDYTDPYDQKISRYVDFTFRGEVADRVVHRDAQWLRARQFVVPLEHV